jgi:Domain of unknown function (DUF4159)
MTTAHFMVACSPRHTRARRQAQVCLIDRAAIAFAIVLTLAAFGGSNLITGDGGRSGAPPNLAQLNLVRAIYDSEGGMGEAYYAYDGRVWARWETDFPQGDDNFSHRLTQLTRINVNPTASSRLLTSPDLADFPMLYMSDPGYMVVSAEEKAALRRYLANGGFLWVDDFWGDAEWRQFANVMREVLPGREWTVLSGEHPIFHTVFDLHGMPQIPALPFASPGGSTAEAPGAHKYPAGSLEEPQMRAWLDDDGRITVIATHNTDVGDGWEREAYGEWYFETFSTKSYMVGVNVVVYAMTH